MKPSYETLTDEGVLDAFVATLRASVFLGPQATASQMSQRTGLGLSTQTDVLRAARELGVVPWGPRPQRSDPRGMQAERVRRIKAIAIANGW